MRVRTYSHIPAIDAYVYVCVFVSVTVTINTRAEIDRKRVRENYRDCCVKRNAERRRPKNGWEGYAYELDPAAASKVGGGSGNGCSHGSCCCCQCIRAIRQ